MSYLKEMADEGYDLLSIGSFHKKMLPYLVKLIGTEKDDLIVDIGAAQGHCVIPLKQSGYNNITIVDIDSYNFQIFRDQYRFECYKCDISNETIPIHNGNASLIISFHLIEHLENPKHFLRETFRLLKTGGVIILVTPDWRKQYKTFYRDPTHIHPYDKESITRLLRIYGFKNIKIHSWGSTFGLGRLKAYQIIPRLGMIGNDLLAIGYKT